MLRPSAPMIERMGGEEALRRLVEHFYDLIEREPETNHLRDLHLDGHGLSHTRVEQFEFLSGFLGGRRYYMEKHRHMNVKEIHAHVPIREEDAEIWLATMDRALNELGHIGAYAEELRANLRRVAMILINDGKVG